MEIPVYLLMFVENVYVTGKISLEIYKCKTPFIS